MAEALALVPDPLVTALRAGEWRPAAEVARAMARCLAPDEDRDPAPEWLRPEQVRSFRRALHAVRRYGGALLADPVGSGKTYVALAVARALDARHPVTCLVPATLATQWRSTARALGVDIVTTSHQAASRGRLPAPTRGPVLVDEAHHFRNPATRRYGLVAPWLVGRAVLLVSATPVVNRLTDLLHQLLLGVRDDALGADGVASLRALLRQGAGSPALGRLVIESPAAGPRPLRRGRQDSPSRVECGVAEETLASLRRLRLSRVPGTEALLRAVLGRAAASSPAALVAGLRRYRHLLLHARDAAIAGRPLDRAALRRFIGEREDQLVWWQLMPGGEAPSELALDDLERVDEVLGHAARLADRPDEKVERLRGLLADGRPTLVFASSRETVRHLRDRLPPPPPAWCTGGRAGLGACRVPRATVLGWFRAEPGDTPIPPVRHLLVTDVAAEGLDLQRAARVVHYDLPWTPMRLDQREGRAVRLGSSHGEVEIVTFTPPPALDRSLRITRTLELKAHLPGRVGLGHAGRALWRWRAELAAAYAEGAGGRGTALVPEGPAGVLAQVEFYGLGQGRSVRLSSALIWVDPGGQWTDDASIVASRLATAATARTGALDPSRLAAALAQLAGPVRSRITSVRGSRWAAPPADCVAAQVSLRLHRAIRDAARRRDLDLMGRLDRALAFAGRGHTAGEALELRRIAALPDRSFGRAVLDLPDPDPRWDAVEPRLAGVLLFVPD